MVPPYIRGVPAKSPTWSFAQAVLERCTTQNQTAIIFEGDDPTVSNKITYQELSDEVCKLANGFKKIGIKKGDRVTLYMPMVPAAVYSMLACARIGAIHSVVFGGFSPESLAGRIIDCKSEYVITADEGVRGQKSIPLKKNTDEALKKCPNVKKNIVLKHTDLLLYTSNAADDLTI